MFGGGLPRGSPIPDPNSDQTASFSPPIFRPGYVNMLSWFPLQKNYTQFQTKMVKILSPFSDQNGSKTKPFMAAHTCIGYLYRGVRLPPPPPFGYYNPGHVAAVCLFYPISTADLSSCYTTHNIGSSFRDADTAEYTNDKIFVQAAIISAGYSY